MDALQCFPSSRASVVSPDGTLIATVYQSRLIIRSSTTGDALQTFQLPQEFSTKCQYLRWYQEPKSKARPTECRQRKEKIVRVLLANEDDVLILDANDAQWKAEISGAASNLNTIANVNFGYSPDEILVSSDFRVKVTIWSLITQRGVEIRDPKTLLHGYGYRPKTGHLAILTRSTAHDTVMLLHPGSYEILMTFDPATVEARGLKWSPDGRWLAVWDAASSGFKVLIYTADGHLFKTYGGRQDANNIGLGVKSCEWGPTGQILAIGDHDERVTLLGKNSFSQIQIFDHLHTISLLDGTVWQEQIDVTEKRSYIVASQPACAPTQNMLSAAESSRTGISLIEFNSEGDLLATRSDAIPSTIWIWSVKTSAAVAVIIHHSPVKKIQWHPAIADLLLIQCAIDEPAVHLWRANWELPQVIALHLDQMVGKVDASWLQSEVEDAPGLMLSTTQNFTSVQIMSNGQGIIQSLKARSFGAGPEDMFDEGNSIDLSPVKIHPKEEQTEVLEEPSGHDQSGHLDFLDDVDDTFHYKRQGKAAV